MSNRPAEAIEAFSRADTSLEWLFSFSGYWTSYSNAAHQAEDYALELAIAQEARRRFPERLTMLNREVRALIGLRRLDEAWERLEESQSLPPPGTTGRSMQFAAQELRAHGYRGESDRVLLESVTWFRDRLAATPDDRALREDLAYSLYWAGDLDAAESVAAGLHDDFPDTYEYLGMLGTTAARRGDRDSALAVSASLDAIDRPYTHGVPTQWRARIAAALGDEARTVSLLREAIDEGLRCCGWVHTDISFESVMDFPPFQQLIKPKG